MSKPMIQIPSNDKNRRPLCVDVDGTLIRTDLLHESVFALLKQNFLDVFRLPFWLLKSKAHLKSEIATRVDIDVSVLPYNQPFLNYLREEHTTGRRLIMATASNVKFARAVAAHLGIFEDVLASDDKTNLSGQQKADRLVKTYGERGFDYAGNGHVDKKIWKHAHDAILVNASRGLEKAVSDNVVVSRVFEDRAAQLPAYLRAMRPQQWLKNLLLFVPLLLAHKIQDAQLLFHTVLAFIAFGLCASSVYLLNDLLDLAADRHHPSKCKRPFAAGSISILGGVILIPLLLIPSAAIATALPTAFQATLAVYYAITLSYSIGLKRAPIIDVLVLAGLYTLRIIAGAAAIQVPPTFWILSFSMFLFLSLALAKRFTELSGSKEIGNIKGRGYRAVDLETLAQFGTSSAFVSVLVLALYINGETVQELYTYPEVLWALCPIMLYLVGRVWLLARRGELDEDPVVFFVRDRRSQVFMLLGALTLLLAS